jgi:integrase/recombinase XerD
MTRLCLPVDAWPPLDRDAWVAAHRRGGLLDDDGLAAHWAPATSQIVAGGYGRFLSFLVEIGDLDQSEASAQRIRRPRVEAYVAHLRQQNHTSTVAARILQLSQAARVMASDADWKWLHRIRSRLRHMSSPARDDRARLVPASVIGALWRSLIERADHGEDLSDRSRALLFRDALMIAVLSVCPIRAKNAAAMAIGTTLQKRGGEWWVAFAPAEMKNRRPYEAPLPDLTQWIDRYIDHYHPYLAARSGNSIAGNALWISDTGKPLSPKLVGQLVSRRTKRELGRDLNPHLFRKIVSTELAIHDPEHVGVAQPLLGHTDYRTTERAYNLGRAIDAARRHHQVVRAIRADDVSLSSSPRRATRPERSSQGTGHHTDQG